ncbi:hypothetical protein FE251_07855 [Georgenia wutianyii]|uniref:Integral membrane protein n=1 Tax=Georgenia wutianyii TaxID=2585135 RepID=A0ABX5VQF8_9MICO|nr:hypothetical protein [Georgenia wutianyii]QDB79289.1 hypothetical protein FE251_07855 [Georgenia wutianyii]
MAGSRHVLLRWGLPRDPRAGEHVLGFLLTAVVTVVVTRGILELTGFPQIGGASLHIAHVLWGGLLMALALLLALCFAGPVVRPTIAFVGGVGFGLFIDEVGKFLTKDNDYFFRPAPMIMYLTCVGLLLLADALVGRRPADASERLAAAADHAVAGLAGGLSPQRRVAAEALLREGRGARGAEEVEALLAVVPEDHSELPDPLEVATRALRELLVGVVRASWSLAVAGALLVLVVGGGVVIVVTADSDAPAWSGWFVVASTAVVLACALRAWMLVAGRHQGWAVEWLRRAFTVELLVTVVALYRIDPWPATAVMAVALLGLGVALAERARLAQTGEDIDRAGGPRVPTAQE